MAHNDAQIFCIIKYDNRVLLDVDHQMKRQRQQGNIKRRGPAVIDVLYLER